MDLKAETSSAAELMFEIDSLYAGTEIILSGKYRDYPLDGLLLEACLLHFRIVWDFFYGRKKFKTDVVASDFVPEWQPLTKPARLIEIRESLNSMLAHLTTNRQDPLYKIGEVTGADVRMIREHVRGLFEAFTARCSDEQRQMMKNPLAHKFAKYQTLTP